MAVTNIIDAVQQRYAGMSAWAGKPADLPFGSAWPLGSAGTLVSYPVLEFAHDGTEQRFTLEGSLTEHWRFELRVYAASVQACLFHFDYWRFDGSDPTSRAGFWLPDSMTVPAGYTFKAVNPLGDFRVSILEDRFAPDGAAVYVLTWPFEVEVQRLTFA